MFQDEAVRAWIYRCLLLVFAAAVVLVIIFRGGDAATAIAAVASILGLGTSALATAHTSTSPDTPPEV